MGGGSRAPPVHGGVGGLSHLLVQAWGSVLLQGQPLGDGRATTISLGISHGMQNNAFGKFWGVIITLINEK